jgi:hypothetical protein
MQPFTTTRQQLPLALATLLLWLAPSPAQPELQQTHAEGHMHATGLQAAELETTAASKQAQQAALHRRRQPSIARIIPSS